MDAYAAKTGQSLWWVNGLPSEMKAGPVLGDDAVYVSGYSSPMNEPGQHVTLPSYDEVMATRDINKDGRLTKDEVDEATKSIFPYVDLDRDGSISRAEWAKNQAGMAAENGLLAFRLGGKGDFTHEGLKWTHRRSIPQLPTTLLYRGVLYMINDGGILTTLDPATGTVFKQGRLRAAVDQYYASPVAADGKVFFASRTGILSVLKAGGDQEVLAVNDLDEEVAATPAIADGRIYVRTSGSLYCFGAK
jgi:outer membrane protein assembly factor BamB